MIYLPLFGDKLTPFEKYYFATTIANKQLTYYKVFTLQSDAFIYMQWSNAIRCNVVDAFYSIVEAIKPFSLAIRLLLRCYSFYIVHN